MNEHGFEFGAYTDFGTLRAAIVGSAEGLALPPFNPTLHHYNDEVQAALKASGDQPLEIFKAMPERWEKTVAQLDSLAALYEKNGIQVGIQTKSQSIWLSCSPALRCSIPLTRCTQSVSITSR